MPKDITVKWQLRILNSFECTGSNSILNLPIWQQKQQGRNYVLRSPYKMQPSQPYLKHQQSRFCRQVQIHRSYSEMLLSPESGLSKIAAAFWNSSRLLSPTQPHLQCCYTCPHRKALGWEELKSLPQPRPSLLCRAPSQGSGCWGEGSEAAGAPAPPGRPWPLSRAGPTTLHRHRTAVEQPHHKCLIHRGGLSAQQNKVNVSASTKHIWELLTCHSKYSHKKERPFPCQSRLTPGRGTARQGTRGRWLVDLIITTWTSVASTSVPVWLL